MALRSIAPFPCTQALRRFPATATTPAIPLRTSFRFRRGTERVIGLGANHRNFSSSPGIFTRGILHPVEQLGAELRLVRAQSSFTGQGVVEGEESRGANPRLLILYSKPGCCLCDGLKEKLEGSDIQLEVRDITTNSEWWNSYQYEIPVLARVREDGIEEPLPRLSPRLSAEQVRRKMLAVMTSVG